MIIINKDNIMPSRHSRVDMRCERNINVPRSDRVKASIKLRKADVMLVIMNVVII